MAKRVGVDKWLFGVILLLVLFGLVMVFSTSAVMAKATVGSPYAYVSKQAAWALCGLIALFTLMKVDYRHYNNPKVVFPAVTITMLLLIAVFAVRDSHHTHRWIRFGGLVHVSTVGDCEACAGALSRIFSADAHSRRWTTGVGTIAARGRAATAVHRPHPERAGPGNGAGVRGQ